MIHLSIVPGRWSAAVPSKVLLKLSGLPLMSVSLFGGAWLNKLSYCGGRSMLRLGRGSVFDRHLERVITYNL